LRYIQAAVNSWKQARTPAAVANQALRWIGSLKNRSKYPPSAPSGLRRLPARDESDRDGDERGDRERDEDPAGRAPLGRLRGRDDGRHGVMKPRSQLVFNPRDRL
jgi:hypothetical protein